MKKWKLIYFIVIMLLMGIVIWIFIWGSITLHAKFDKMDKLFDDFNREQIEKIREEKTKWE